jgi:acetylornithine deacetylase
VTGTASGGWADVDAAIQAEADGAFSFLESLIAARSTVGEEACAQEIVAGGLARLGFAVTRAPVPEQTAWRAPAGVAQVPYAGRDNLLGLINPGRGWMTGRGPAT